jgi:aminopeptidase YwaD
MKTFKRIAAVALAAAVIAPFTAPPEAVSKFKFRNLKKVPKPKVTGKQIVDGLEEYVTKFPLRQNGLPGNDGAAAFLAKEAEKYGFKSRIREFEVTQAGVIPRNVKVVESIKRGTKKPNEWIAFVAHYDAVAPDGAGATVEGAYDPASGANIMRYFAKQFQKIKTNRSIAMLWFDAEENGLLASEAYAEMVKKRGQKIKVAMGFDMVGIGYPAKYCICVYHGTNPEDAELGVPLIDYVHFKYLKFPEGDGGGAASQKFPVGAEPHVCNCGPNIRNSDESSFADHGYFTLRWTGMRTASDYPGYHQAWDTVEFMDVVAGGRDNLEKGMLNTFKAAYYTAMVIDQLK